MLLVGQLIVTRVKYPHRGEMHNNSRTNPPAVRIFIWSCTCMKCHHASERMMAIITQPTNNKAHKELKSKKKPVNNEDGRYEIKLSHRPQKCF